MSTRKPLPQISPCPCPKHCKATVVLIGDGYYCRVISSCGFAGPIERVARAAILAWNRRSDVEVESRVKHALAALNESDLVREAERRGAMTGRAALKGDVDAVLTAWGVQHVDKIVGEIFQGGEVLPAKGARKR